jgi:hypothetical protein
MAALNIKSTESPSGRTQASKVLDMASTTLEAALTVLEVLSNVTKNVPYLSTITGCIQELIDIQKACSAFNSRCPAVLYSFSRWLTTRRERLSFLPRSEKYLVVLAKDCANSGRTGVMLR